MVNFSLCLPSTDLTSDRLGFDSHSLTLNGASITIHQVIDNPTNFHRKPSGYSQLNLLASSLPTSMDRGLDEALLGPVREFLSRESKQVRAQLVRVGFSLASCESSGESSRECALLDCLSCVVEALHAGSLMIDDIQDADQMRRGKAALHLQIGVPRAINAANWLYFWPTDLLRKQALTPDVELEIYRLFHKTMMRAHQGQALDLAHDMSQVSQLEANQISVLAIELKTGELMGMCSELGAIAGGADGNRRCLLAKFGQRFGVALQMFNDIGEASSNNFRVDARRPLLRPSWVWAVAAQELDSLEFTRFQCLMAHRAESSSDFELILRRVVSKATELARTQFENCMDEINDLVETSSQQTTWILLQDLIQKVKRAYA